MHRGFLGSAQSEPSMSKRQTTNTASTNSLYQTKLLVYERDRERCANCGAIIEDPHDTDLDHITPRIVGGSHRLQNLITLCRRCHDAKHDEGMAPTVRLNSTGDMDQREFIHFEHFLKQQIPALTNLICEPGIDPMFGLNDLKAWHIPVGDLVRLDDALRDEDVAYKPLAVDQYM